MSRTYVALSVALCVFLIACSNDDGLECELDDATTLAESDWPSSRHDPQNTGRVTGLVMAEPPTATCIFPRPSAGAPCDDSSASISTTVIVSRATTDEDRTPLPTPAQERLTIGAEDGLIRQTNLAGEIQEIEFEINLPAAPNTTLLGADGSIFVTDRLGTIRRFAESDGEQLFTAGLLQEISVAPNLGPDGVIYSGTVGGLFVAACPNGAFRFSASVGEISVAPAIAPNEDEDRDPDKGDNIVLVASDSGRINAFEDEDGDILWTFFTGTRLDQSSLVVATALDRESIFIVPDNQGQIFAGRLANGQPRLATPRCLATGESCDPGGNDCSDEGDSCSAELIPYRAARCVVSGNLCRLRSDCDTADPVDVCAGERTTAEAALGQNHYYLATEGVQSVSGIIVSPGSIYAFPLDFAGGGPDWTWTLPDGGLVQSSPMVVQLADDPDTEVLVFGADFDCQGTTCARSVVYALSDGEQLWEIELPDRIGRAAPSLRNICIDDIGDETPCRRDDTGAITDPDSIDRSVIYIGTSAGKVYELDWPRAEPQ